MAAIQHVTLTELLEVQGRGISEIDGWSLLCQSAVTLLESSKSSQSSWLITPDTMLLYRSGAVKFCPGIPYADGNHFIAPELYGMKQFDDVNEMERTYVYSLGMTVWHGLEYQSDGQEQPAQEISEHLEAVLSKMTIEAADERISLDLVYKACKNYQDKNASVILSNKVSHMVESVLGEQLEFSFDTHNFPDMDDESLERELQYAASMRTSSERLSSCGATGSSQSLTSSQQGYLSSTTSSFRRVARHHSNLSIRSLGSSSHEQSVGLVASLPLPSQRWSSYDGLHVPPLLNAAALSFEGERRQLPASPQSITTRRHSEAVHTMHGDVKKKEEQRLSRPKSADISGCQEMLTLSNDNSLEMPPLHPPSLKKLHFPSDMSPSSTPITKMSPKVAASLEKINHLLASNPPLQETNTNNPTTEPDVTAAEPTFVNAIKKHNKFPPSPLLSRSQTLLTTTYSANEIDEAEEQAPPVPLSSPPDETTSNVLDEQDLSDTHVTPSADKVSLEDTAVTISNISSHQSNQHIQKSLMQVDSPTSCTNGDSLHVHQQEIKALQSPHHNIHTTLKQYEHPSLQQEQFKQYRQHHQRKLQHEQQQEDSQDKLQKHLEEQQHNLNQQQWQSNDQYQQKQQCEQKHEQGHEHEQEHEQEYELEHEQEQKQKDEQEQQKHEQGHELEDEYEQEHEQKPQHEQEQHQHEHKQEHEQEHEQEHQWHEQELPHEQQKHHEHEQEYKQEDQQYEREHRQKQHKQEQKHEQERWYELEEQQQHQQEQQQHEQEEQQPYKLEQKWHEQEYKQEQLHEQKQQYVQEQSQTYELEYYKPKNEQVKERHEGDNEMFSVNVTTADKSVTPEMSSTYHNKQVDIEKPGYATDTKRVVLKLATPCAVTELSRAHSEHQIDRSELQPLARRTHSVVDNTLQMAGTTEYAENHSKQVKYSAIKNDDNVVMSVSDKVDISESITSQDDATRKHSTSHEEDIVTGVPQPLPITGNNVIVTVFPVQNDQPEEHSNDQPGEHFDVKAVKVDRKQEERIVKMTSDEVKLRHTPTSGLLMKSNSTHDFKDKSAEVNDPRRHSALPVSRDFDNEDVPDYSCTAESAQPSVVGEKFEPTFDEDWRQLQVTSVEKLQNMLGPEFTSLVGGKWERAQPVFYGARSNRRQVNVVLLNDKIYSVTVELSSKCQDVFNQVVSYLSLGEPHVFGLSIVKGGEDYFLDLNKRLVKHAPDGWVEKAASSVRNPRKPPPTFTVYFRIRFFVENIHELKMNQTRHQYYLQLRQDIRSEKVYCHEETALLLASYSLQVEKGDYGPALEGREYYQLEDYMPHKAINQLTKDKINSVLPHMHAELKGLSKESAEWQFLQEVQKLTEYGQIFYHLYKERHKRHSTVVIGFCIRGLILYDIVNEDTKIPTHKLSWKQIENIVFKQRRFELYIAGSDEPLVYYVSSPKKALYLFGLAKSYHYFQLKCREPVLPRPTSPAEEAAPILEQEHEQREVIKLLKEPGTGLGFKIMSGKKKENREGIFVKSIIKGTPAYLDGRMKPFDQIVAINGVNVVGCDHREVGRMVQQSPPITQITVIHHHHDEEEHLLRISHNKHSPLGDPTEQEEPTPTVLSTPNYNDDSRYQTVLVTKENDHLGFSVKGSIRGVYISNLEPGTATARKKLLQVGSVIVAVNGESVEGQTVHEVLQLLLNSHYQIELTVHLPNDYSASDHDTYVEGDQFVVTIDRGIDEDLGMQIVKRAATHIGSPSNFFFVKSLSPGSPAYCCNKLIENDIILQVNDKVLKDCTTDEARQILYKAGQHVSLLVCRSVITVLSNSPSFVDDLHSSHTNVRNTATPSHGSHTSIRDMDTPSQSSHTSIREMDTPSQSSHTSLRDMDTPSQISRTSIRDVNTLTNERYTNTQDLTTPPHSSHTSVQYTSGYHEVEVNVTLIKGEKSFGFKIDKHQSGQTGRGVFILAVDSEPALSDGRLRQGDEIIKVNDIKLVDRPHQTAVYALRQIKSFEKADLVIRRVLQVEECKVSLFKEKKDTTLGLVVGEKPLPHDQDQQLLGVTILQIHSGTLACLSGSLHVDDVIDKINDIQVSGSVDKAVKMLREAIGTITLHISRYTSCAVSEPQPIPKESPGMLIDQAPTIQQEIITSSPPVDDPLPLEAIERGDTPSPPSSSPPPLSPVKSCDPMVESCDPVAESCDPTVESCDPVEEWTEPQLTRSDDNNVDSCSSLDSTDAADILNEIDQSANHSNLTATVAKEMNDSLGIVSNLSEDVTGISCDLLTESHNSMCPPPLPQSPPPDL